MFRALYPVLSLSFLPLLLTSLAVAQQPATVYDHLACRGTQLAGQLAAVPDTKEAWEQQRRELLQRLGPTLGLPPRQPMRAALRGTRAQGELVLEDVSYLWAEQVYVSATVIRAAGPDARRGALVFCPGTRGHWTFRPYRALVEHLARDGWLILFVDDPRAGLRQSPAAGLYATAGAAGLQVAGIQVFDALRGLDYLLTRSDVEPERIGVAGLGAGAVHAVLAAALEPRFHFVIAAEGVTTYEALLATCGQAGGPPDPSAFVAGLLAFSDLDRVAACLVPRPVLLISGAPDSPWPQRGFQQVQQTLQAVERLHGGPSQVHALTGKAVDDLSPHAAEAVGWLKEKVLPGLASSSAPPLPCEQPDQPDFSLLAYAQRRIAAQAEAVSAAPASTEESQRRSQAMIAWLRQACSLDRLQPCADEVVQVTEGDGVTVEQLALGIDADWRAPAVLMRPSAPGSARCGGVILSHGDRDCAASPRIAGAARQLAAAGYWVLVLDHASVVAQSGQPLAAAEQPSFYGDEAVRFYGPADAVALPPLALRVAENLAACRHLAARAEVDAGRLVIAGSGLGGIDACLAAVLEPRIAGVASIDATTVRDWAQEVAPHETRFFHLAPYLPGMLSLTDWDGVYALLAPRPLLLARLKDGWPRAGLERVAGTAAAAYKSLEAEAALNVLSTRDAPEEPLAQASTDVRRQLRDVAGTLVPAPPRPGLVGNLDGLKSRATVDSAAGLIWLVSEMDGYEQGFVGEGYRLLTWSFFNDNAASQQGRAATPLIFRQDGEKYLLTGIGRTRTNAGSGLQTFEFEPVQGTNEIGDGCYFGWHDGSLDGPANAGVVEFEDAPDGRMTILTGDGQLGGQRLQLGAGYRLQSEYPRRYSIMAEAKKP